MRVQQATVQRILELAKEHNLTINALAEKSGVADSTLRLTVSPTYGRVKNTGMVVSSIFRKNISAKMKSSAGKSGEGAAKPRLFAL